MIKRTHVTLEETVGEYVVLLHLPVGISFDTALQIVNGFSQAIQQFAKEAADKAAELEAQQVEQPELVDQAPAA
jgi:hypothetical protein